MERSTLSNSENVEPGILSYIYIRPEVGFCSDVTDLSICENLKIRTPESEGPLLEKCSVLADDTLGGVVSSTSDNKEQPPKPLRKRRQEQHKETVQTVQTGKRGEFPCIVPCGRKINIIFLVGLLFGNCCIADGVGAQNYCKMMKPDDEVKMPPVCLNDECQLHFFDHAAGRDNIICDGRDCLPGYRIDKEGNIHFTASNDTAGKYAWKDYNGNKVTAGFCLELLYEDPTNSEATSNVPSGLLMTVAFAVLGFFIHPF